MAFLCTEKAYEVVASLGCLMNSQDAYQKTWNRLASRFGDTQKLMNRLRQDLVAGPPINNGDSEGLLKLGNRMFRCEVSFQGWGKT